MFQVLPRDHAYRGNGPAGTSRGWTRSSWHMSKLVRSRPLSTPHRGKGSRLAGVGWQLPNACARSQMIKQELQRRGGGEMSGSIRRIDAQALKAALHDGLEIALLDAREELTFG